MAIRKALILLTLPHLLSAFYLDPHQNGRDIQARPTSTLVDSPFVRWPTPLVQSSGDYREEAWLESHIGGPLYENQASLPRLPISEIKDTVNRLLPSTLPLAESEEEQESLLEACRQFPREAQILQERLVEYDTNECANASWLQHRWQTEGYLQVRNPLMEISYFLFVPDDKTLSSNDNMGITRAAGVLTALAESRKLICSGEMAAETIGSVPLCSTGFKYLFHSTRIPQPQQDKYHIYDPSVFNHVIVSCKGEFFKVDFVDNAGDPLPLSVLEHRLQQCVSLAEEAAGNPQMGYLTTADRDFWTSARQELLEMGGSVMKEALQTMESGAFVLCLDDSEPNTMTEAANVFWKGTNRWADKSFQIVCTANGKIGYVGEHSMLDAAPVIPLLKRIIKTTYKRLSQRQEGDIPDGNESNNDDTDGVTNIFAECWSSPTLNAKASELSNIAKEKHEKLASAYECQVLEFTGYGKKFIKGAGFVCHDLVQQALQLASYRMFGKQVGTYEAALTRTFLHGRTETARPVSPQSKAFVECMGLKPHDGNRKEKALLLKKAAAVHDEYQRVACDGRGVDRHLFGLSGMVRDGDIQPSLFSDPLFLRSKTWKLSTSSVIFLPGFGPSTEDGIAIGYRVEANSCQFTCTSRSDNNAVKPFCELLHEALTEIGNLLRDEK